MSIINRYKIKPYANLRNADLSYSNSCNSDLCGANLRNSDLRYANLKSSNLCNSDLRYANLRNADLSYSDLSYSNLSYSNLRYADLKGASLRNANLRYADLKGANLSDADLPDFQITPKGFAIYGFKKLANGAICTVLIPPLAGRTATLVGRKCRAEYVKVISGNGFDRHTERVEYKEGETVYPDKYDPDIRVQCTHGIHFFLTPQEAEDY